jgi:hypothetical protein
MKVGAKIGRVMSFCAYGLKGDSEVRFAHCAASVFSGGKP